VKLKIVILISVVLIFGIIAFLFLPHHSTKADVVAYVFSNQQIYDQVASSTNVTAQLLHYKPPVLGDTLRELNRYNFDRARQLPVVEAQQVRDLVLAPTSYRFSTLQRQCTPDYGVMFAFEAATQTVRVAVCFKCDQLGVFLGHDNGASSIGEAEIDPSHNKFLAFAKSIFTNSPDIQNLSRKLL
jgi:hypothetical protein